MNEQPQCPLFRLLPAELRQIVYTFSLTSPEPITDPVISRPRPRTRHLPRLGTALLRTCRKVYSELDVRPLYSGNRFNFTLPILASEFLDHLVRAKKAWLLKEVCFDLRNALTLSLQGVYQYHRGSRFVEWEHYLTCPNSYSTPPALTTALCHVNDNLHFTSEFESLTGLKVLVLDVVGAQRKLLQHSVPSRETVANCWGSFAGMVECLDGLERDGEVRVRMVGTGGDFLEVRVPDLVQDLGRGEEGRDEAVKWWVKGMLWKTVEGMAVWV